MEWGAKTGGPLLQCLCKLGSGLVRGRRIPDATGDGLWPTVPGGSEAEAAGCWTANSRQGVLAESPELRVWETHWLAESSAQSPLPAEGPHLESLAGAFHGARGQAPRGAEEDVLQSLETITSSQGFGLLVKGTKYLGSVSSWSEVGSTASARYPHTSPTPTARGRGLCRVTAAFPPSLDVGCPTLQLLPKSFFSPLVHLCLQQRTPSGAVTPGRPS